MGNIQGKNLEACELSRRPDWIPERRAIPIATKRAVLARSRGICEASGCSNVGKEFNHKVGVAFAGGDAPDDVELLCVEHHKPHTEDIVKRAAKADRMGGRAGQYARRMKAKASGKGHKWPSQKIPSRPFPKRSK